MTKQAFVERSTRVFSGLNAFNFFLTLLAGFCIGALILRRIWLGGYVLLYLMVQ
jgi:hypothetical protein